LVPSNALSEEFMNGSDQYNFFKKGIPVLGITTGLHEDYHHPTDDVDKIDYHKMKRIADLTFLVANEIANKKKL
jgi:Zn-dependent M28 family amino/carboxypeptidase